MSSFWLIVLHSTHLSVVLVEGEQIVATGPKVDWNPDDDSITLAVDQSLSQAAENHNLSPSNEPTQAAFVLPPDWVGSDGKITSRILSKIELVCRQLKLEPMGFVGQDEAIIESFNSNGGVPASFVLIHFDHQSFDISLIFLGQIKKRIFQSFTPPFTPTILESVLNSLDQDSTLPPRIIVFGHVSESAVTDLTNYPWLNKPDFKAFLQLPEITYYPESELIKIYVDLILHQLQPPSSSVASPPPPPPEPVTPLNEVSPESFGFGVNNSVLKPEISPPTISNSQPVRPPSRPTFTFPKIKLPHIRIKLKTNWLFAFVFVPTLLLIPFFFLKTHLTLYINPYVYSQQFPVTLTTKISTLDTNQKLIPVKAQSFTVTASATTPSTGKLTIGNKARGEITIYNQQNKVQNIAKGAIITDPTGKKFELFVATNVASSSSNLDAGIVTLGQTKATVIAVDVGPEYNLTKDTKLIFKDYPDTLLLARCSQAFSGGSRQEVNAVALADRTTLDQKLQSLLNSNITAKIDQEFKANSDIIKEFSQTKKNRIDFSREVNEEADELSATLTASVTLFSLAIPKPQIITAFLATDSTLPQLNFDTDLSSLSFQVNKSDANQASAVLNIQGQALPKIDISGLQRKLIFRTPSSAAKILQQQVDRLYDFRLVPSFILPIRPQNIIIDIKTNNQ